MLRDRAEETGMKVTAYIHAAALDRSAPVDRPSLRAALRAASEDVSRAGRVEQAPARRAASSNDGRTACGLTVWRSAQVADHTRAGIHPVVDGGVWRRLFGTKMEFANVD